MKTMDTGVGQVQLIHEMFFFFGGAIFSIKKIKLVSKAFMSQQKHRHDTHRKSGIMGLRKTCADFRQTVIGLHK